MNLNILPMRERADKIHGLLGTRLNSILKNAMKETGFDMWIIICQEDNPDPVYSTMIPMDTWSPILQILVFCDPGGDAAIERINISGTDTHDLYQRAYEGQLPEEQWPILASIVADRDPKRIGINIGSVQWAAGGLTHNLYTQLCERLPTGYKERLESAEPLATVWLSTLTNEDIEFYEETVAIGRKILAHCLSPDTIIPDTTTVDDVVWSYWQICADHGLDVSFMPHFKLHPCPENQQRYGPDNRVIHQGDLIHSDVGIRYLRFNTDHQEWAYVLRGDEADPPASIGALLREGNRLQDIFMAEFHAGRTGNELLANILSRARREGIPEPKVYSHSLGLLLHEPGPLIGLPWEQTDCGGRGEVKLAYNSVFTMELSVSGRIPEWGGQSLRLSIEQDVVFTEDGCRIVDDRQTEFHLV